MGVTMIFQHMLEDAYNII